MVRIASSGTRSAVFGAAVLASACTTLLGIDGEYTETRATSTGAGGGTSEGGGNSSPEAGGFTARDAGGSAGRSAAGAFGFAATSGVGDAAAGKSAIGAGGEPLPAGGGAPAAGGHTPSTGGMMQGAGGTMGTGGATSAGNSGASAGGKPSDDAGTAVCPSGTFTGTYDGTDHPSTGGTVTKAPIAGGVTLHLVASGTSASVTGNIDNPIDVMTGGITGMVRGNLDCNTGTGVVTLLTGAQVATVYPPTFFTLINGDFDVTIDASGKLTGTFAIHELADPIATGSGTWSATRSGP